ncbi:MAG: DUF4168 domain-containing protein [Halothece sp.]
MKTPSIVLGTIASLFLASSYIPAEAQQQAPQQQNPQQQNPQQQNPQQQQQPGGAETSVDSDELERFANAFESVQKIQDDARETMMQAIEDEGLDVETYNQAFRAQQQGGEMSEDLSQEEQEKFEQADSEIDDIEKEAQSDIENAITDADLEVERFEEIWISIQQDPELQQKVQEAIQE